MTLIQALGSELNLKIKKEFSILKLNNGEQLTGLLIFKTIKKENLKICLPL